MSDIRATRSRSGRSRLSPELIAIVLAVLAYGVLLAVSVPSSAGERPRPSSSGSTATSTPRLPSADPLRQDILGLLEIDSRLIENRATLRELLKPRDIRASEVARVLRDVSQTVRLGSDRASRLAVDEAAREIGARLELIYADADRSVETALDSSIGNEAPYRTAATEIVDLFLDLPEIDKQLRALLSRGASPSPSSSASSSPPPSASPTAVPSSAAPSASPSTRPSGSASPAASGSVVDLPGEMLRNRSFESGIDGWEVLSFPAGGATATSDRAIATSGSASLRLDIAMPTQPSALIRVGQVVPLSAGKRYIASFTARASAARSLRVRVIGPNQELHGVTTVNIGPTAGPVSLTFTALIDDPAAHLWIELPGTWTGTVWLDDASMLPANASP